MLVLLIDGDSVESRKLEQYLKNRGHGVTCLSSPPGSSRKNEVDRHDIVFMCPDGQKDRCLEFLTSNQEGLKPLPVIVWTGTPDLEDAVVFMKHGAYDFWVKPVDGERLVRSMKLIASKHRERVPGISDSSRPILSDNPIMQRLKKMAGKVAGTDAPVFIQGESGTGKELFARYIHRHSRRVEKPFLAVNCAALPENLLESELFGYEKGAFTGAVKAKAGKFELASGGTLLLDEVTEMDVQLQAKLLRVLQENEVDRLGGRFPVSVDVRVIATTNAVMEEALASGRFRKDLYYRLNVIPLKIPPLRERKEDIDLLCRYFMDKYNEKHGTSVRSIDPAARGKLWGHVWPGNVRELENVVQRAILLAAGSEITLEGLIFDEDDEGGPDNSTQSVELMSIGEMEKRLIYKALETVNENRTRAAEILGISVRTLRNKLNEYRAKGANVA